MSKRFYYLLFLLFIAHICHAQVEAKDIRLLVLRAKHIGKEYTFSGQDGTTTHLKYLGDLHTRTGKTYKILNSIWIWGLSHRATSRILIYSNADTYIGNYHLNVIDDRPDYIKRNQLVFRNRTGHDCNVNTVTYVSFYNGIPEKFVRKCDSNSEDIFSFDKE